MKSQGFLSRNRNRLKKKAGRKIFALIFKSKRPPKTADMGFEGSNRNQVIELSWLILLLAVCFQNFGCQGNTNSSSRAPFDLSQRPRLFGNDSVFANNRSSGQDRYAVDLPDVRIDDGSYRQLEDINRRLGAYDSDNELLNTELAGLKQKLDLANQYNFQLKEQLAGATSQMSQFFAERESANQQIAGLRIQLEQMQENLKMAQQSQQSTPQIASSGGGMTAQLASRSTIRANNSLIDRLSDIQVQGAQVRMDGDVIRIEFPSDQTFVPGSYQIQPNQMPLIQNVVANIQGSFPRQIVGIEAHWDGSSLGNAGISEHQLTATQSLAIFNEFVRLGLPKNQLFTMAMASNRPRHSQSAANGINPNRRIEVVIYPETYDGS